MNPVKIYRDILFVYEKKAKSDVLEQGPLA